MPDRSWPRGRWMPLFCLLVGQPTLGAQPAIPNPFHLVPLAEGVYASIQVDPIGVAIDGNSAVIISDRDVVVVDTHNAPANAEALVREIKRLTPKPVRYVINTHWHGDHHHGNEVFRRAYPGVEFIAHTNTALDLAAQGNDSTLRYAIDVTFPAQMATWRKALAEGKRSNGQPLTPDLRRRVEEQMAGLNWLGKQLRRVHVLPPTLTIDHELLLHRGERTIEIRYLGRANTRGDLVVYLPRERIVFTGDIVVSPSPFAFGSYLGDWIKTLDSLHALPVDVIVPGHGEPQHDWRYVELLSRLFQSTLSQAKTAVAAGKNLEDTRASIHLDSLRDEIAHGNAIIESGFDRNYLEPIVEGAWREARGDSLLP